MTPEVPSRLDSLCFYMDLGGRDFQEKKKKGGGGGYSGVASQNIIQLG